jgi:hypothetical protein
LSLTLAETLMNRVLSACALSAVSIAPIASGQSCTPPEHTRTSNSKWRSLPHSLVTPRCGRGPARPRASVSRARILPDSWYRSSSTPSADQTRQHLRH